MTDIVNNIFGVNAKLFNEAALTNFNYQYLHNDVYKRWVDNLSVDAKAVKKIEDIPFLPVSFFKTHKVVTGTFEPEVIFESSGTTQTTNSRHYVKDLDLYIESCVRGFELFYGSISQWCIIGLLPAYMERQGSSLVVMVDEFIKLSGHERSGVYLYEHEKLNEVLMELESKQQKTLLIGVTFGLLDYAEKFTAKLEYVTVMETGGMKGRRREMIREEVHETLTQSLGISKVHSEYGMTELLSQAYSKGDGIFYPPPWMKVLVRDEDDPLKVMTTGRGIINIIDLANIHSCCFIATDDAGVVYADGSFEVLGRVDNSDIRGCSLMLA